MHNENVRERNRAHNFQHQSHSAERGRQHTEKPVRSLHFPSDSSECCVYDTCVQDDIGLPQRFTQVIQHKEEPPTIEKRRVPAKSLPAHETLALTSALNPFRPGPPSPPPRTDLAKLLSIPDPRMKTDKPPGAPDPPKTQRKV